jgi:hypothetical protein
VYGITDVADRDYLMTLARVGKQHAWWQQFDLPYATYFGLEAEATSISDYTRTLLPGLLQIPGYARSSSNPPTRLSSLQR